MLSSWAYLKSFLKNRIPSQLVIQLTNRCNAQCPQCGMRVNAKFPRSTFSQDALKKILDAEAAKGVQALSFTGGESLQRTFGYFLDQKDHSWNLSWPL